LGLYSGLDYAPTLVVFCNVIPYQLVIRMGRAELQHLYQVGSDRILILVIVADGNLRRVAGRGFLDSYIIAARVH